VTSKKRASIWQAAFIEGLRNTGNVRAACHAADISRQHAYRTRHSNNRFAKQWADALEEAADTIEAALLQRSSHEP
jgi:hypothetical protein